jgi:hypothetical protein
MSGGEESSGCAEVKEKRVVVMRSYPLLPVAIRCYSWVIVVTCCYPLFPPSPFFLLPPVPTPFSPLPLFPPHFVPLPFTILYLSSSVGVEGKEKKRVVVVRRRRKKVLVVKKKRRREC